MNAINALIEEIRDTLSAGDTVDKDRLIELATAYLTATRQVRDKAMRCRDFLREGLRNEAIELAKEPPGLFEGAAILTFPERGTWIELCERGGIELRHYDLDADVITRILSDLGSDADALNSLLKTHRLLALGQAPLAARLNVLRKICKADPARTFWREDVLAFETARLEELNAVVSQAIAAKDRAALQALRDELKSAGWLKPPPPAHCSRVEQVIRDIDHAELVRRFPRLADDLRQAHSMQDEARCRDLLQRWDELEQQVGAPPDPSLADAAAPVREWLKGVDEQAEKERAFKEACDSLTAALDRNEGLRVIEARHAGVLRHNMGIPRPLASRAERRMEELRREKRRKYQLTAFGIVVAAVLLAAGVYALAGWLRLERERKAHLAEIQGMLGGNLPIEDKVKALKKVTEYVTELESSNPRVGRWGPILTEKTNAETTLAEIDRERKEVKEGIASARGTIKQAQEETKLGITDSQGNTVRQWLRTAGEQLNQAEAKAQFEEDKIDTKNARDLASKALDDLNEILGKVLGKAIAELEVIKHKAKEASEAETDKLQIAYGKGSLPPVIGGCRALVQQGIAKAQSISQWDGLTEAQRETPKRYARDLQALLPSLQEWETKVRNVSTALDAIPGFYKEPDRLGKQLLDFKEKFADHPLADEFGRAAALAVGWRAIQDWSDKARLWPHSLQVNKSEIANARIKDIEDHLKAYPASPFKDAAEAYLKYVQKAQKAFADDSTLNGFANARDQLFGNKLMSDTFIVVTAEPKTYYTFEKRLPASMAGDRLVGYSLRWICNGNGDCRTKLLTVANPVMIEKDPNPLTESPQARFVRTARERVDQFKGAGWETFYLELAEMARGHNDMDPIVRAQIFTLFINLAKENGLYQSKELDDLAQGLSRLKLDRPWMDPNDKEADQSRLECTRFFEAGKSLTPWIDSVPKAVQALRGLLVPYRPVGILFVPEDEKNKDKGREVRIVEKLEAADSGDLYIYGSTAGGAASPHKVGTLAKGKAECNLNLLADFPRASIIYLLSTRKPGE